MTALPCSSMRCNERHRTRFDEPPVVRPPPPPCPALGAPLPSMLAPFTSILAPSAAPRARRCCGDRPLRSEPPR
eukprot:1194544-Prorocentrum_minimum.AAC.4